MRVILAHVIEDVKAETLEHYWVIFKFLPVPLNEVLHLTEHYITFSMHRRSTVPCGMAMI